MKEFGIIINLNFVELDRQRNIRMIIICIQLNLAIYEEKSNDID